MAKIKAPRITSDSRYLLKRNGENHMQSMLNSAVANDSRREQEKWKWAGYIKPSSLATDMCMDDFQDTCDTKRKWTLVQKLSFLYGNAIHAFIGKYLHTNFPASYYQPTVPLRTMRWYEMCHPEIPMRSEEWHAKGVIDYAARIKSAPVLVDWKTCHHDDAAWTKFIENPWVSPGYILQSASYCFLAGELGYFPEPPQRFGIVFINLFLEPSDDLMWKEIYYDYAPYAGIVRALWTLAVECVEAKLAGERVACKNPYCKKHGKGNPGRLVGGLDPWSPVTPSCVRDTDFTIMRSNNILDRASDLLEGIYCLEEEMSKEDYLGAEFGL